MQQYENCCFPDLSFCGRSFGVGRAGEVMTVEKKEKVAKRAGEGRRRGDGSGMRVKKQHHDRLKKPAAGG